MSDHEKNWAKDNTIGKRLVMTSDEVQRYMLNRKAAHNSGWVGFREDLSVTVRKDH